jgi:hypothetical protein
MGNPTGEKTYVTPTTAEGIFVRSGAGVQYSTLVSVFIGEPLEILDDPNNALALIGQPGQWLHVKTSSGVIGWVATQFIQRAYVKPATIKSATTVPAPALGSSTATSVPTPTTGGRSKPLYLHTNWSKGIFVRSAPNQTASSLASVETYHRLEVVSDTQEALNRLGKENQWIQIRTPEGVVGWCAAWLLETMPQYIIWPGGHALAGIHGPAEAWPDRWDESVFQTIGTARMKAVKLLCSGDLFSRGPETVISILSRLQAIGIRFVLARLVAKFGVWRPPEDFVNEVLPSARALYQIGIRYFEVHNEPNLHTNDAPEGMGVAWKNGAEFGEFFRQSVALMRPQMPEALFGFPGVSPGAYIENVRADSNQFLTEADEFIRKYADFMCMHAYWGADGTTYQEALNRIRAMCNRYPEKLLFVTEFSNPTPNGDKNVKGQEYAAFYSQALSLPPNLGGLFSFLASAPNQVFPHETWVGSPIAQQVGSRR